MWAFDGYLMLIGRDTSKPMRVSHHLHAQRCSRTHIQTQSLLVRTYHEHFCLECTGDFLESTVGPVVGHVVEKGRIAYTDVIRLGLHCKGRIGSVNTVHKRGDRVMMNAPAQGVLPFFYNGALPYGERPRLDHGQKNLVCEPFCKEVEISHAASSAHLSEAVKVAARPSTLCGCLAPLMSHQAPLYFLFCVTELRTSNS